MEIIILHKDKARSSEECSFLRFAISGPCTGSVVMKGLAVSQSIEKGSRPVAENARLIAIPAQWQTSDLASQPGVISYDNNTISLASVDHYEKWTLISNGRYSSNADTKMLADLADSQDTDIMSVNVDPQLAAYCEKVRITPSNHVVGFRRWYCNSIKPEPIPNTWPHHLFIRSQVLRSLLSNDHLSLNFETLMLRSKNLSLTVKSFSVGGTLIDLSTADGLLAYATGMLNAIKIPAGNRDMKAKLFGKVLTGKNVTIGNNVKIIGPAIIEDGVEIADNAFINNSIIATGIAVNKGQIVNNSIVTSQYMDEMQFTANDVPTYRAPAFSFSSKIKQLEINDVFRIWPLFSYPRFIKRLIDITGSAVILMFIAPVLLIIAISIKLTSRGPVFYKAVRQGKYGQLINCIKFRTMIENADQMQEKLRVVNEVDGPQFKIVHDPRISSVGRFLRDTCLDETPQFFNVLLGQMSIVGPRPSPESENSQCPSWRDARLSLRPGITGLWQISRTRQQSRDFQEWVYYDTEYVRNVSLKTDLWICLKTALKLINDFIDQF